jgi:hypothetical protein
MQYDVLYDLMIYFGTVLSIHLLSTLAERLVIL